MTSALFVLAAYLMGSISFAVAVSWAFGLPDPHTYGSGNPGATNVLRTGKKAAAVLTLIGDAAKGAVAMWLAQHFAPPFGVGETALAAVALAAFLGHLFPLYLRFRGGKGVATAAGILLAMDWRIALTLLVVWVLVTVVSRYSSLAAIVAAALSPLAAFHFLGRGPMTWAVLVIAVLLVWRHRGNIERLLAGNESRIRLSRGR
ncbi:MAG TPA: glycerol-3-phosphate 1-O-acyltransferase PlsY [Burkholderiales bacterium]|jgi:glycerol-3-phosphate acyltransferase PlsY|nr:glycerol-3-phosphate 1-O-acyltransferase PlsY [Burkholderiales bacterium]